MKISLLLKYIRILFSLNFKTIRFNFHYFQFKDAIRFPVYVDRKVVFNTLKGNVIIKGKLSPGKVSLGYGQLGVIDNRRTGAIWDVRGTVIFEDQVNISRGACISVGANGTLSFGKNVIISFTARIICHKSIHFGDNSMISWDSYVIDTDFHPIYDESHKVINENQAIQIGNNVWIGFNCLILKGCKISDNTIVGANSVLGRNNFESNSVILGNPAKVVKENVYWKFK